ncbi:MAG: MmcQ/YjbR family DNA-binding protein [Rhizomicrobium sp.]
MRTKARKAARHRGVTKTALREIALSFPAASEGTSYGKPSFLVAGKFFTRLRSEDDSVVLIVGSIDERDMLLESDPMLFHITDHYRNYRAVLARTEHLDAATLRGMLERRWRAIAPKKLVREAESGSRNSETTKSPRRALGNRKP